MCYIPLVETKRDALILKVSGDSVEGTIDPIASELPVTLIVNQEQLVTLLCTPSELRELAIGFLLSEGILQGNTSIDKLVVNEAELEVDIVLSGLPRDYRTRFEKRTISSGCGKGITFTTSRTDTDHRLVVQEHVITPYDIQTLLAEFRTISKLYLETGGVHSAALSDGRSILSFSEDIGRHNAVDKLIGKAYLQSVPLEDKILITSGRVTSEIMTKAGRNRFPILISRAAPSCMAISYAEDMGITLIGFARGDRMNIYAWPARIKLD